MKLIALTGGIASGKSTIARRLEEHGAVHIDADVLAREAVAPGSAGLAQIREHFGTDVIAADGSLDRAALGALVFADEQQRKALEAIVHPAVRELAQSRIQAAQQADPHAIIVYDVPLLVEANVDQPFDLVVVAEAPAAVRIARMVNLRNMTRDDAESRIANQASDAQRRALADVIIDTGATIESTLHQADELWRRLTATSHTED